MWLSRKIEQNESVLFQCVSVIFDFSFVCFSFFFVVSSWLQWGSGSHFPNLHIFLHLFLPELSIWVEICVSQMPPSFTAEHHRLFVNDCAIVMSAYYLRSCERFFSPHLPWQSHTRCTNTYSFRLTHNSCTHIALRRQCTIDPLADWCPHRHRRQGRRVITQSMLEILFTFTPKGPPALGKRRQWHCLRSCVPAKINGRPAQKCGGSN